MTIQKSQNTGISRRLTSQGESHKDPVLELLATACVLVAGMVFVIPFLVVAASMTLAVAG